MPARVVQFFCALIMITGLAACGGLPALPAPVASTESGPESPISHNSYSEQVASSAVPESAAPESPLSEQTPPVRALSTPALIDQALAQGEITSDQRLLYLAYAVYEYESLPAQFRSDVGWRGTSTVREIRQAADTPKIMCSLEPNVQSELRRVLGGGVACD